MVAAPSGRPAPQGHLPGSAEHRRIVVALFAAGVATSALLYSTQPLLFTCYVGSSVFGSAAGNAWSSGGWPGVVALAAGLLLVTAALAQLLRRTPSLPPAAG